MYSLIYLLYTFSSFATYGGILLAFLLYLVLGGFIRLSNEQARNQANLTNSESDPYKVLGVNRSSTDSEIRKKWIKLNKEHHPDNLIAKGMPKEFIKQSNKELAAINIAYDKIKEIRGIS